MHESTLLSTKPPLALHFPVQLTSCHGAAGIILVIDQGQAHRASSAPFLTSIRLLQVLTFLLDPHGSIFKPGTVDKTKYDHYSMLKTIEDNWDLGDLGRHDKAAIPFNFNV
jgi:hypothetical protein